MSVLSTNLAKFALMRRSVQSQAKSDLLNRQISSALILLFSITVRAPVIHNGRWMQ